LRRCAVAIEEIVVEKRNIWWPMGRPAVVFGFSLPLGWRLQGAGLQGLIQPVAARAVIGLSRLPARLAIDSCY
jgi:hypothetical protein